MRLLDREPRAFSSTPSTFVPTRITQASNFSFESRGAWSDVMATASMPNWRKHSESKTRVGSCRSTSAARAENFLEEDKGIREFPKGVLPLRIWVACWGSGRCSRSRNISEKVESSQLLQPRRNPILARDASDINRALGQWGTQRCYYPG